MGPRYSGSRLNAPETPRPPAPSAFVLGWGQGPSFLAGDRGFGDVVILGHQLDASVHHPYYFIGGRGYQLQVSIRATAAVAAAAAAAARAPMAGGLPTAA